MELWAAQLLGGLKDHRHPHAGHMRRDSSRDSGKLGPRAWGGDSVPQFFLGEPIERA